MTLRSVALAVVLGGCASPMTRGVTVDPSDGAVPLIVESAGPTLEIHADLGTVRDVRHEGRIVYEDETTTYRRLCVTPCTLYAKPDRAARLWVTGDGVQAGAVVVDPVPARGARVVVTPGSDELGALYGTGPFAFGVLGAGFLGGVSLIAWLHDDPIFAVASAVGAGGFAALGALGLAVLISQRPTFELVELVEARRR